MIKYFNSLLYRMKDIFNICYTLCGITYVDQNNICKEVLMPFLNKLRVLTNYKLPGDSGKTNFS